MRRTIGIIVGIVMALTVYADALLTGTPMSGEGWRGLDLGKPYIITIVGWKPTSSTNAELGMFEGANRPDFLDALPLYMHEGTSTANQMNYARVESSRGFRYVRYRKSDNKGDYKIDALEFYGDAGKGDNTHLVQLTNLPTVVIHTKDNIEPYDKVNEIDCFISIISDNGQTLLADSAQIRLRGNASMGFPKKPYRIKFAHKHKVLGAPASAKKWTLINNYGDKTLMRNQLAFELSRRFGMPYTPFCAYVDVIVNGDYKGCYQLCDQIEVKKGRVDIEEGGYLIEADAYAGSEASMFWSAKGTPVTIKYPKEDSITWEQSEYIRQHYDKMESNWKTYLDLNTFLRHFLVGEFSGNTDTYWSTYFYKHRANDTLYVGPCWDFDLAFENDNRTYPIKNLSDYIYRTNGSTTGYMRTLVDKIVVKDTQAKQQLAAIYEQARRKGLTEESFIAYIDEQEAMLQQSQRLNFIRWPIMNQRVHQNPKLWGSYTAEVENVRNYIRDRFTWMDAKLGFDPQTLNLPMTNDQLPMTNKVIINGRIYIMRGDKVYTLTGHPTRL